MNIIKRDGSVVEYDADKIRTAIGKANAEVHKNEKASKEEIEEDKVKMLSRILYCEMTTDEYTSPELIPAFEAGKLGVTERTVNNELFGIAVLIFKTLMLGKHPFSTNVGSLSPLEAIKNNEFPYMAYYSEQKKLPSGCWNILWSHLPYDIQDELLPEKWEIEHILPVKWENNYDLRENEKVAKEKIEHLGNKTPFEKKLNIIATNNYFSKKKSYYLKSEIKMTREIGKIKSDKWDLDDIVERDVRMTDRIVAILKLWDKEYK